MHENAPPFINRELSWLEFNARVLSEARQPANPILERLRFLAITASNLDEFFMIRIGGLRQLDYSGQQIIDGSGLTVKAQLAVIAQRVKAFVHRQYAALAEDILPGLENSGICIASRNTPLLKEQRHFIEQVFEREIYPVTTPIACPTDTALPLLAGLANNLCVRLAAPAGVHTKEIFAIVPVPRKMPRFVPLPNAKKPTHILLEDIMRAFVERFFPGMLIKECVVFRITRNADLSVSEDAAGDLLAQMQDVLEKRKESACVRLEVETSASKATVRFLQKKLEVKENATYKIPGPLNLADFSRLAAMSADKKGHWPVWQPQLTVKAESMFALLARQDILLFHPYESFLPVLKLIEEAADDPNVLAIKQILYRTSENSAIINALLKAARNGKLVTTIVELKARFDESRNIRWAREMERAGAHIIFGVQRLKTHAKACLIVRREAAGIRRYLHVGTGNYNEITAALYSDISYLTCRDEYAADLSKFFNTITGCSNDASYQKIHVAPLNLREYLLELIANEIRWVKEGKSGCIKAKMNSLVDPALINALYSASQAGVKISLNVRGICCLRPGVRGLSENISVRSIVGRFLEHSRIFYFHNGDSPKVMISSADWMPRNLDRRVELLVPIEDPACRTKLMHILETCLRDNVKSWELLSDGTYQKLTPSENEQACNSQEFFCKSAKEIAQNAIGMNQKLFSPALPPKARHKQPPHHQ